MKIITLLIIGFLGALAPCQAQTPTPQSNLVITPGSGTCDLDWEAVSGRTYFIQYSFDLTSWYYLPTIEYGYNATINYWFSCGAEEVFLRLQYTDEPTGGDHYGADFDNDGYSNYSEVMAGTSPFIYTIGTENPGGGSGGGATENPNKDYPLPKNAAYRLEIRINVDGRPYQEIELALDKDYEILSKNGEEKQLNGQKHSYPITGLPTSGDDPEDNLSIEVQLIDVLGLPTPEPETGERILTLMQYEVSQPNPPPAEDLKTLDQVDLTIPANQLQSNTHTITEKLKGTNASRALYALIVTPKGSVNINNPENSWNHEKNWFDFQGVEIDSPGGIARNKIEINAKGGGIPSDYQYEWTLDAGAGTLADSDTAVPDHTPPAQKGVGLLTLKILDSDDNPTGVALYRQIDIFEDHLERNRENFGDGTECFGLPNPWNFTRFGAEIVMKNDWNCHGSVLHMYDGTGNGFLTAAYGLPARFGECPIVKTITVTLNNHQMIGWGGFNFQRRDAIVFRTNSTFQVAYQNALQQGREDEITEPTTEDGNRNTIYPFIVEHSHMAFDNAKSYGANNLINVEIGEWREGIPGDYYAPMFEPNAHSRQVKELSADSIGDWRVRLSLVMWRGSGLKSGKFRNVLAFTI